MFGNAGLTGGMGTGQEAILRELMRGQGQGQGPINGSMQAPTAQLVQAPQQQGGDLSSVVGKLGNTAAGAYLMNKGNNLEKMAKAGGFAGPTQSGGNLNEDMIRQADMLRNMGTSFLR